MNRVAMIAAVVGLSAAPAFAATQSNNAQPANPPMQQSSADHASRPSQQQIDQRQTQLDRQQERVDHQQAALDRQQAQQGSRQNAQQAQNQNNAGLNPADKDQAQNTAINQGNAKDQQRWNHHGQTSGQKSSYDRQVNLRANRATKALNMLEANGFTQFSNFHRVHRGLFTANVDRNGRWMAVEVDPLDNQIMRG